MLYTIRRQIVSLRNNLIKNIVYPLHYLNDLILIWQTARWIYLMKYLAIHTQVARYADTHTHNQKPFPICNTYDYCKKNCSYLNVLPSQYTTQTFHFLSDITGD